MNKLSEIIKEMEDEIVLARKTAESWKDVNNFAYTDFSTRASTLESLLPELKAINEEWIKVEGQYWKERCEAAERFINTDDGWNEWLQLKIIHPNNKQTLNE